MFSALRGGSRSLTPNDFFMDPAADDDTGDATWGKMSMDYWEFHSQQMAQRVMDVAEKIKAKSQQYNGRLICGLWGYHCNGWRSTGLKPGSPMHLATWDLKDILADSDIDYLVPLQSYRWTKWGTPVIHPNFLGSLREHDKGWITEYDMRTHITPENVSMRTLSDQESEAVTVPAGSYVYDIWARSYVLENGSSFTPNIPVKKTGFYFVGGTQAEASAFVTALTNQQ